MDATDLSPWHINLGVVQEGGLEDYKEGLGAENRKN